MSDSPAKDFRCIAPDVKLGQNVKLSQFVNLYGCQVGDDSKIGVCVSLTRQDVPARSMVLPRNWRPRLLPNRSRHGCAP